MYSNVLFGLVVTLFQKPKRIFKKLLKRDYFT